MRKDNNRRSDRKEDNSSRPEKRNPASKKETGENRRSDADKGKSGKWEKKDEKSTRKNTGVRKEGYLEKFNQSNKPAGFRSENSPKESNPEGLKTVYKGRGKDERPVFETVSKEDFDKRRSTPKPFKKSVSKGSDEERPSYNLDKFEKNHGKKNAATDEFRLNKYIANSGICSRREADTLISKGEVKVNGKVVTELGFKVMRSDTVEYKGKKINPEKPVYILLNKPKDFITTTDDPMERKTVMNLIASACPERVFPVGRLDRNTTGLLLFTNDGELAAKLSHPSNQIKKIYQVTLDKGINQKDVDSIAEGLTLEDGPVKVDDIQVLSKDRMILGLEIHVGKNRIVRRIFAHLGYEVTALDRVIYAGLDKKDLPRGKFRFLNEKEVIRLKFF